MGRISDLAAVRTRLFRYPEDGSSVLDSARNLKEAAEKRTLVAAVLRQPGPAGSTRRVETQLRGDG